MTTNVYNALSTLVQAFQIGKMYKESTFVPQGRNKYIVSVRVAQNTWTSFSIEETPKTGYCHYLGSEYRDTGRNFGRERDVTAEVSYRVLFNLGANLDASNCELFALFTLSNAGLVVTKTDTDNNRIVDKEINEADSSAQQANYSAIMKNSYLLVEFTEIIPSSQLDPCTQPSAIICNPNANFFIC